MNKYWPGPLSIILRVRKELPGIVTGGKKSVGLRMPDHQVALALIEAFGPIAATSANLSGRPSAVTAEQVREDLDGKIAAVLDAGYTGLGLESSLIDLSCSPYCLLRPGKITREELQEFLKCDIMEDLQESDKLPHYQTSCQVVLSESTDDFETQQRYFQKKGLKMILVYNNYCPENNNIEGALSYYLDLNARESDLFTLLREAENRADVLIFAPIPLEGEGITTALADRIRKAARAQK
jgi:L-threonylcarbamoyladenylate synthase